MLKRYIDKTQTGINAAAASVALAAAAPVTVKNAGLVTVRFARTNHFSGSGLYEIYGSIDGVNYTALPLVGLLANTNAQTLTRVLSVSLAANADVIYAIEPLFTGVRYLKGQYTKTIDGNGTIEMVLEDELMS